MTMYLIHEVSAEWRRYVHCVEADSPEEAKDKFHDGKADLASGWEQGVFHADVESLDTEIARVEKAPAEIKGRVPFHTLGGVHEDSHRTHHT